MKFQVVVSGAVFYETDDELIADRQRYLLKAQGKKASIKIVGPTNVLKACWALGWQGGTIHQVAEATELTTEQILNAENIESLIKERI